MKNLYLKLVNRMASPTNLIVLGVLWILVELVVRPGAELEISRWSNGKGVLDLPLFVSLQMVAEQIARYGIEGRRIYSFVVLTMETTSAALCFLFFSALLFLFALPFRSWWAAQCWKITLLVFLLHLMTNSLLLHLLSGNPQLNGFFVWCFVVLNGCNQIAHWVLWLLAAILTFQEAKRMVKKHIIKAR